MKKMILSGKNIHRFFGLRFYLKYFSRISNEKVRSIQYELLTARTEVEQTNEKVCQ